MKTMVPARIDQTNNGSTHRAGSSVRRTAAELKQLSLSRFIAKRPKLGFSREAERRHRAQKLIEINEHIRRHIARELHDDIGQRLSLLSIRLGMLQQFEALDERQDYLAESLRDLDALISDVHHLSDSLHSSRIERLGLKEGLREILRKLPCGMRIDFAVRDVPEDLPPGFTLCFFRIAQESLNNSVKHSGASRARIEVAVDDGVLTMTVRDFGIGFDRMKAPEGLGLISMEERMAAIGGTLCVNSALGAGTTITATAMLSPETALVND